MKVSDPQRRTAKVRRRWLPWRRRIREMDTSGLDFGGVGDDPISAVLAVIGLVLAIPFSIVLVVLLREVVFLLLLLPLVVLLRVAFGLPWTIEAVSGRVLLWTERVRGWRASQSRIEELAGLYRRGRARIGRSS